MAHGTHAQGNSCTDRSTTKTEERRHQLQHSLDAELASRFIAHSRHCPLAASRAHGHHSHLILRQGTCQTGTESTGDICCQTLSHDLHTQRPLLVGVVELVQGLVVET